MLNWFREFQHMYCARDMKWVVRGFQYFLSVVFNGVRRQFSIMGPLFVYY